METRMRSDLFGELRPLVKGDVVQRGDIFIDNGQRYEMNNFGICIGVQCLGRKIIKDIGGWHRPSPIGELADRGTEPITKEDK